MNHKKAFTLLASLLLLSLPARAALFTYSGTAGDAGAGGGVIAAGNPIPLVEVQSVSGLGSVITDVILTVHLGTADGASDILGMLRLGDTSGSPYVSFNPTGGDFTMDLTTTFGGLNPNNNWTLSFANPSGYFDNSLTGWSLDITAVPEPLNVALGIFGVLAVGGSGTSWYLKRRKLQWRTHIWPC